MYELKGRARSFGQKSAAWIDPSPPPQLNPPCQCSIPPASTTPPMFHPAPAPTPALPPSQSPPLKSSHVWHDWLDLSSIHGVLDLGRVHYGRCWRAAWITVLVVFTAVTLYSIHEVIGEYIRNPTIQNYRERSEVSFLLPDVTVCTHERLNQTVLYEMGASRSVVQDLMGQLYRISATKIMTTQKHPIDLVNVTKQYDEFRAKNQNITYYQLLMRSAIKCENVVKNCSWGTSCCGSFATPFLDMTYGMCYRFKTARPLYHEVVDSPLKYDQSYPGTGAGAQMLINPSAGFENKSNPATGVMIEFVFPDESASFSYSQIPGGVFASVHVSLQVWFTCLRSQLNLNSRATVTAYDNLTLMSYRGYRNKELDSTLF